MRKITCVNEPTFFLCFFTFYFLFFLLFVVIVLFFTFKKKKKLTLFLQCNFVLFFHNALGGEGMSVEGSG